MSVSPETISRSLHHKITAEIKQKGLISFAQFMQMALYEPGLGYYSAGLCKLGGDGDFITAPELGSLFARSHVPLVQPVLEAVEAPVFLELGAGSGRFCADLLQALAAVDCLPARYAILEVSADLQRVQQQHIQQLPKTLSQRVCWLDRPPAKPFNGVVFANEVVDALPVEVFRATTTSYEQLCLVEKDGQWQEHWRDFSPELARVLHAKNLDLAPGYRSEFLPQLTPWLQSVTAALGQGLVLMHDYGYGRRHFYHPQRHQGTLVCQRRHRAHFNPYQDVGLQDITAFVDFTALAEAYEAAGLAVTGFTTQGSFLLDLGIEQCLDPTQGFGAYHDRVTEMKHLVLPENMGEKFKSLAGLKGLTMNLPGFSHNRWQDL